MTVAAAEADSYDFIKLEMHNIHESHLPLISYIL